MKLHNYFMKIIQKAVENFNFRTLSWLFPYPFCVFPCSRFWPISPVLFPYIIFNFNPYMFRTRSSNFNPYMLRIRTSIFKIFRNRTVFRTHFQNFPYPVLIPFVLWVRNRYGVRKRSRTPEYGTHMRNAKRSYPESTFPFRDAEAYINKRREFCGLVDWHH